MRTRTPPPVTPATAGPWTVGHPRAWERDVYADDGTRIAVVIDHGNVDANAALVAAAPALRDALRRLHAAVTTLPFDHAERRSAHVDACALLDSLDGQP